MKKKRKKTHNNSHTSRELKRALKLERHGITTKREDFL